MEGLREKIDELEHGRGWVRGSGVATELALQSGGRVAATLTLTLTHSLLPQVTDMASRFEEACMGMADRDWEISKGRLKAIREVTERRYGGGGVSDAGSEGGDDIRDTLDPDSLWQPDHDMLEGFKGLRDRVRAMADG